MIRYDVIALFLMCSKTDGQPTLSKINEKKVKKNKKKLMSLRKTFSGKARIYNTNTHKQLRIDINLQYSILLRRQYDLSELIISLLISYDFCVSRILCLEGLSVLSTLTVHDRI